MNQPTLPQHNKPSIAFVHSSWHQDIVENGLDGFLDKFGELGFSDENIDYFKLPGAFEIPLKCKNISISKKYDLIIASGFVVNGGIYQHEFVASAVINGLMNVQLETGTPILSMVLTPQDYDGSKERNDYFLDHFKIKGHEIAEAAQALLTPNTSRSDV